MPTVKRPLDRLLSAEEPAPPGKVPWLSIARVVVISILVSELITIVLTRVLLGEVLEEGMLIALVCAGPISAWIAHREFLMRDLIEQQRDRLSAFNAELKQRNFDLDSFSRAVAHDLRNPLTVVIGMAEILTTDPTVAEEPDINSAVQSILQAGRAANETIEGLLLLHGINRADIAPSTVDTDGSVNGALDSLHTLITESAATIERPANLPDVVGHAPWIEQIWVNLIGNAIKYGGSPPRIELGARRSKALIRFEVRDNGPGIADADRDRIFHEFERGSSDVEGHGLGLAIVKRVVDRLEGRTGVEPRPGGGSTFYFALPAAKAGGTAETVGASAASG